MAHCLNCGTALPADAKFCAACGAAVPQGFEPAHPPVGDDGQYADEPAEDPSYYAAPYPATPAPSSSDGVFGANTGLIMMIAGLGLSGFAISVGILITALTESAGASVIFLLMSLGGIVLSILGRRRSATLHILGMIGIIVGIVAAFTFTILAFVVD